MNKYTVKLPGVDCAEVVDKSELIFFEFIKWCEKNKDVNIIQSIPFDTLYQLSKEFFEEHKLAVKKEQIHEFVLSQIPFLEKFFSEKNYNQIRSSSKEKVDFRERYISFKEKKYHSAFLYPKGDENKFREFVNSYWQDIDILTGETINFYFDENGSRNSGFKYLQDFPRFKDKFIVLPALVIWSSQDYSKLLSISLKDMSKSDILEVIQKVVYLINDNKTFSEIRADISSNYKIELLEREYKPIKQLFFDKEISQKEYQQRAQLSRFVSWKASFMEKTRKELIENISSGRPNRAEDVLLSEISRFISDETLLLEEVKEVVNDFYAQIVMLRIRRKELNKNKTLGVASFENLTIEENKLNYDLITFIQSIS